MRKRPESFLDILNTEFKWPDEGERLSIPEGDRLSNAQILPDVQSRLIFMWDGYKKAGDILVECPKHSRHPNEVKEIVYPTVFCYRHSIELASKWFILTYGRYANLRTNWKCHSLIELWQSFRMIMVAVDPESSHDDIEATKAVERIICEMDKVEPRSETFRYATNPKGQLILVPFDELNLENLAQVMDGVHNYFNGTDGYLDNLVSAGP